MLDISLSVDCLMKKEPTLQDLFYDPSIENLYPESTYFQSIVRSIVYQQLSGKAAKTIYERLVNLISETTNLCPNEILKLEG